MMTSNELAATEVMTKSPTTLNPDSFLGDALADNGKSKKSDLGLSGSGF
jgi:hypothetical protein